MIDLEHKKLVKECRDISLEANANHLAYKLEHLALQPELQVICNLQICIEQAALPKISQNQKEICKNYATKQS